MATTTGDVIVEKLLKWGVDTVFGMPGDGINGIFESLRKNQDKIRFIQVRHEEAGGRIRLIPPTGGRRQRESQR
jgi:thiamine pyrophosphate-dependent acetolactate synthase large subunit-like protein